MLEKKQLAEKAGRKFEKALACDPNDMVNQHSYGLYLCFVANDLLAHAVQVQGDRYEPTLSE